MDGAPPLVINAALTGMVPRKSDNPSVPETPDEIAADVERCVRAGASVVHLHARDGSGEPTYRREAYAEVLSAVRSRTSDVIVCVSTSGRTFKTFEERSDVLGLDGDLRPEMASLTLGSLNFSRQASVNEPDMIRRLAETMQDRGIVPELEIFDLGMLDFAHHLIDRGVLRPPHYFNLILGSLGTLAATPLNLATLADRIPTGSAWSGGGIGRHQRAVTSMAVTMGGHVRIGLEDNLWLDDERQCLATNEQLVSRTAGVAHAIFRAVADAPTARRLIGLA
jgi:uncharacterized protein (DUF849 family)